MYNWLREQSKGAVALVNNFDALLLMTMETLPMALNSETVKLFWGVWQEEKARRVMRNRKELLLLSISIFIMFILNSLPLLWK